MTENKQFEPERFEPDGNRNNHQYDYSILNSRYEANTKRNEIIEWNKDSCNAQYVGLERIAEKMNFKQMQLEKCRKGYEKLYEENEQLKKDVEYWKQVASQYSNELNVFEHCKKYKTKCKDNIYWNSDADD